MVLQKQNADIVFQALSILKESDIPPCLDALGERDIDILMKYVYRALAEANNCAMMLKWHEKIVERRGLGSIVRTLTERRTV